ncbi:MAG: hypothetical protein EZS28_023061 [Streblomastix strix]|uniref:Uncharacterized protein n=1 Tax=Streblomastix strix TaxID=222440 RepID=A0A5J4VG51_9EUKA|nr:MAG: hypothetical protein EZS28_023061 [Streblomastix strix]
MDRASDYNVDGSLLGLGEFILLEILFEIEIPQDAQQFLVLCRKTFQLLIHPRFARIVQSIIIGIADASCSFAAGKLPWEDGNDKKTVGYNLYGNLNHLTVGTEGNQRYKDGQRIAVEVNMTTIPRKATFFVDDIEQPNFIIGIPEAIRFWVYTYYKSSSFTVIKFERLIKSTSQRILQSQHRQHQTQRLHVFVVQLVVVVVVRMKFLHYYLIQLHHVSVVQFVFIGKSQHRFVSEGIISMLRSQLCRVSEVSVVEAESLLHLVESTLESLLITSIHISHHSPIYPPVISMQKVFSQDRFEGIVIRSL